MKRRYALWIAKEGFVLANNPQSIWWLDSSCWDEIITETRDCLGQFENFVVLDRLCKKWIAIARNGKLVC